MCGHCGCGDETAATVLNLETGKETAVERTTSAITTMRMRTDMRPRSRP